MPSPNFRHIAACSRQAYHGARKPHQVLLGAFNLSVREIPQTIQFFYEDGRILNRLTDEDLREIFYSLTDVFPEEVGDDPDLIHMMANLSEEGITKSTFAFIFQQMEKIFETDDNTVRALIMRAILKRTTANDAFWLILRLTRNANPFKRRDVIRALGELYGISRGRLHRESLFTTLPALAERLRNGDELIGLPTVGQPILLPLPSGRFKVDKKVLPFLHDNQLEIIRGERLVLHHTKDFMLLQDPNGDKAGEEGNDEWSEYLDDLLVTLPYGLYVIERVPTDDYPLAVVDVWFVIDEKVHELTLAERRNWLTTHPHFLKDFIPINSITQLKKKAPKNGLCFIHNGNSNLSFSNLPEEVVRFSTKATGDVFRLVGGVWRHDDGRGLVMNGWKVAARDGIDGYYNVGIIPADGIIEKKLVRLVGDGKAMEGELVLAKGATFVQVDVHFADYDERGIIIQGVITDIIPSAGIADVIPVEDVEMLVGGEEE